MFSPWTHCFLLFSLSLLLSLVAALAGEDDKETPQPDFETAAQHRILPTRGPHRPNLAPVHPVLGPKGADILTLPLGWLSHSSEETDSQGVIGEYADTQDSSEISLLNPTEKWPQTFSPTDASTGGYTSKVDARLIGSSLGGVPAQTTPGRADYWLTESRKADMYGTTLHPGTQNGENLPTLSAKHNQRNDTRLRVLLSVTVPAHSPDSSALSTGPVAITEGLSLSLATDKQLPGEIQEGTGDRLQDFTDSLSKPKMRTDKGGTPGEEWHDSETNGTILLPDCNRDSTAPPCKTSNQSSSSVYPEDLTSNESQRPSLARRPPLFVPLYSDWNSALATWGLAWEAHIYGLGSVFAVFGLISVICLLGLPLRCPPGCPYFTLLHLFLLAVAGIRAFSLVYDAYGHQERLPPLASFLMSELPFPCLTSAFSLAFLLLSLRSRMHLSLSLSISASFSVLPKPCLLLCLSLLHFGISMGCVGLLLLLPSLPALLLLLPRGLFVCLSVLLSCSYLVFYCFIRADTKHIYRLKDNSEGGGSPVVMRPASCPFAEVEDWGRAACAGIGAALALLGCGGLQLYGILHALGLGGVEGRGFQPWPWWGYQLGCRLCEAGVYLGLSLIGTQPLFCHTNSALRAITHARPGSWSRLTCASPSGGPSLPSQELVKSPGVPYHYPWSGQGKQEKVMLCNVITRGQSEALPLCSMVDSPPSGIDAIPHPSYTWTSVFPLPAPPSPPCRTKDGPESQPASQDGLGLDTDSTGDLRPPSPINLSRSIDQALFSEALFSHSLFDPPRMVHASSSLSLNSPSQGTSKQGHSSGDGGLYRTSSCGEMDEEKPLSKTRAPQQGGTLSCHNQLPSPPEQWGSLCEASLSSSSQGLCCSVGETGKTRSHPWAKKEQNVSQNSLPRAIPHLPCYRRYRTLSLASQDSQGSGRLVGTEHLSESRQLERDLAVQAEFVNVCKQIDSLSVCSDTIDL